jgi:hypothetical protein
MRAGSGRRIRKPVRRASGLARPKAAAAIPRPGPAPARERRDRPRHARRVSVRKPRLRDECDDPRFCDLWARDRQRGFATEMGHKDGDERAPWAEGQVAKLGRSRIQFDHERLVAAFLEDVDAAEARHPETAHQPRRASPPRNP